jgi:hypothetical protein
MAITINGMPVCDLNAISLAQGTGSPPEIYIPLWWYSGSYSSMSAGSASAGSQFVRRSTTTTNTTQNPLHTLNTNWGANTKYAFEAAIQTTSSSVTAYAALWDVTSNSLVSASQISTTSYGIFSVVRSGQFTLTPGHSYAITLWASVGGTYTYLTDASLIVFPS